MGYSSVGYYTVGYFPAGYSLVGYSPASRLPWTPPAPTPPTTHTQRQRRPTDVVELLQVGQRAQDGGAVGVGGRARVVGEPEDAEARQATQVDHLAQRRNAVLADVELLELEAGGEVGQRRDLVDAGTQTTRAGSQRSIGGGGDLAGETASESGGRFF